MQAAWRWSWSAIALGCCAALAFGEDALGSRLPRAESEYRCGHYAAAYRLASAEAAASKQSAPRAQALQLLATICYRSGRLREAIEHGEQYLRLLERAGIREVSSVVAARQEMATLLAEASAGLGLSGKAGEWFNYALRIRNGKRSADPAWEAQLRLRWAKAIYKPDAPASGLGLYREAADAAERVIRQIEQREVAAKHRAAATDVFVQACLKLGRTRDSQQALEGLLATQQDRRDRIDTLIRLGDVYHLSSDDREVGLLEQALSELHLEGDGPSPRQAHLLERLAAAGEERAQRESEKDDSRLDQAWEKAAACYEALAEPDDASDSRSFEVISNLQRAQEIYVHCKKWPQGASLGQRLLEARDKTLLADDPSIFRARTALGICYAQCERSAQATAQLQPALAFWEKYQPTAAKELADTLQNLAELARKEGDYEAAQSYLDKLLPVVGAAGADRFGLIECHVTRGNVFSAQGKYASAIDEFELAEDIAEQLAGAESGSRIHPLKQENRNRLRAVALLGKAAVYKARLQFDRAIAACEGASKLYGQSAERIPCLTTLATLYLARYEFDASRQGSRSDDLPSAGRYIETANHLARGRDLPLDQRGQLLHVLALIQFREAMHLRAQGGKDRLAAARQSCTAAIDYWKQAAALGDDAVPWAVEARSASYLAEAQLLWFDLSRDETSDVRAGVLEEASANSEKAIKLVEQLRAYPGLNYRALLAAAKILRLQAQHSRAAELPDDAEAKSQQAIDRLIKAVKVIELPRSNMLGADAERAAFFSQFVEAYELLINWLVERDDIESAIAYFQISRNRTFIEQVMLSEDDLRAELQPGKRHLVDDLRKEIEKCDRLRREIQQATTSQRFSDDNQLAEAARQKLAEKCGQLDQAQDRCDLLQIELQKASDSYRNLLQRGLKVEDWPEVRRQVLGTDGLLLVYHLGPTASQLFVVTPDAPAQCYNLELSDQVADELKAGSGIAIAPAPLNAAVVDDLVGRHVSWWRRGMPRGRVERGSQAPAAGVSDPLTPGQLVRLAELVLPDEVRKLIRRRRPPVVTVVPDGALHRLPLESLMLSAEPAKYVLDDESLPPFAYAPSAMLLAALQSPRAPAPLSLLTVGKRDYSEYDDKNELPLAEEESRYWHRKFSTIIKCDPPLLDKFATKQAVRAHIRGKRFVHFAVHGEVTKQFDSPLAASLALTPGTDGDDGLLDLQEIYALPLGGCELAVLSACQSNLVRDRNLEAGSTLTRAFLSAGAKRVVASLWSVADDSTRLLMEELADAIVESLETGPNYAVALQRARRRVKQYKDPSDPEKDYSDPFHWAPFVLIGPAD